MGSKGLVSLVILVALSSFGPSFAAEPEIKKYNVSGDSVEQLVVDLDAKGVEGGWGHTRYDWQYTFTSKETDSQFKVATVNVTTKVVITMPNWPGYSSAGACLKASWDGMYKSLRNHENGHVERGKGVAAELKAALLAVPPQGSGEDLQAELESAASNVVAANKTIQDKYDTDTDHGRKDPNDPVQFKPCP